MISKSQLRGLNPFRPRRQFRTAMPGFDAVYYLYWYRDVAASGLSPLHHYLVHGWKEGRDPSAGFSTRGYLLANPDVASLGGNPLLHFLETGLAEGRRGWEKDIAAPAPAPSHEVKLLAAPSHYV